MNIILETQCFQVLLRMFFQPDSNINSYIQLDLNMQQRIDQPENYYTSIRDEIQAYIPNEVTKVIEIGCGDANFSKFLSGKEYWGVEPNTNIDQLELPNIFKVIKSNYEDAYVNLPDYYFDLVVVNDVIEHMDDHDHFFESIKKK